MSPRTRVALLVAVLAAAAAGATVAATVLIWGGDSHAARQVGVRAGAPPFLLDELGVRNDPDAQRLRRAGRLYSRGAGAAGLRAQLRRRAELPRLASGATRAARAGGASARVARQGALRRRAPAA